MARQLTVINGYFPQGESRDHPIKFPHKQRFYAELQDLLAQRYSPQQSLMLIGDMNVAPQDEDIGIGADNAKRWLRDGKCSFLPEEREWLEGLLDWGLCDTYRLRYPESQRPFQLVRLSQSRLRARAQARPADRSAARDRRPAVADDRCRYRLRYPRDGKAIRPLPDLGRFRLIFPPAVQATRTLGVRVIGALVPTPGRPRVVSPAERADVLAAPVSPACMRGGRRRDSAAGRGDAGARGKPGRRDTSRVRYRIRGHRKGVRVWACC